MTCTAESCIGNYDCDVREVNGELIGKFFSIFREYHYGKEKPTERSNNQIEGKQGKGTHPPESTFKKLAPSKNRYTLLKDEL